jgi:hypothetical protein
LNPAAQGLERLFKTLANHSELISQAYFSGVIYRDNQNERALNQLKQLKLLVKYSEDGYRLSGRFSQFIDSAISSDRARRLDTDLASWIETLEQQIGLYQDAWTENRMDDADNYYAEIERLVFDLSDTLEENTGYLLMLVNSRFANVRTLAEKQKQNLFYISRLEKLVNAISLLQPAFLLELVEDQPILFDLLEQQLIRLFPLYQQRLQDILDKLKVFLFELRQIEARAQRVQGFAFFLRQNPGYQLQDWSERDNIPDLWNQIKPLQLSIHADPSDHGLEAELIDIAQKLKTDCAVLLAKQQQRSVHAVTHGQQTKQVMPIPVYRQQIRLYFLRVRNNPGDAISALAFQQAFVNELEPAIWLACVMNECLRQQHKHYQINYVQTKAGSLFSGNKKIKDILLCYAPPVNA